MFSQRHAKCSVLSGTNGGCNKRELLTEVVMCGGVYCDNLPSSFLSSTALRIGNAGRSKRERARTRNKQIAYLGFKFCSREMLRLKTWRRFKCVGMWLLDMKSSGVCVYIYNMFMYMSTYHH